MINKDNFSQKKLIFETKGNEVWLEDEEIIQVKIGQTLNEKIIEELLNSFREIAKKLPKKAKVLVDMRSVPRFPGSFFRKK